MELKPWQHSTGTQIQPLKLGRAKAPSMVNPRVQRFVPLDDPNDYLRAAQAEANMWGVIGKSVATLGEVGVTIKESSDEARIAGIIADYTNWSNTYTFQNTEGAPFSATDASDPVNQGSWEGSMERYNEDAATYRGELTERAGWLSTKAQDKLTKAFSSVDETNQAKIRKYVNDQRISQGRAGVHAEAKAAKKPGDIAVAYNRGGALRLFNAEEVQQEIERETKEFHFRQGVEVINNYRLLAPEMSASELEGARREITQDVLTGVYGDDPTVMRKMLSDLDIIEDLEEDKREAVQGQRTHRFMVDFKNATDKSGFVADYMAHPNPDVYYGESGNSAVRDLIFGEGIEKGPADTWNYREVNEYITGVREMRDGYTYEEAVRRFNMIHPQTSESQYDRLDAALADAGDELRKPKLKSGDMLLGRIFGGSLSVKGLYLKAEKYPEYPGYQVEADKASAILSELNMALKKNPDMDVEAFVVKRSLDIMQIPPLISSDGRLVTDPTEADLPATRTRIASLGSTWSNFLLKMKDEGYDDDLQPTAKGNDPARWRANHPQFYAEMMQKYHKFVQEEAPIPGNYPYLIDGMPVTSIRSNDIIERLNGLESVRRNIELSRRLKGGR